MVIRYDKSWEMPWDNFILNKSVNGCFLHTRNFLGYHGTGKFIDHSLLFLKGDTLAAVMPANEIPEKKELISHQGSTFGGIIIGEGFTSSASYDWIFSELLDYLSEKDFRRTIVRTSSWLYYRTNMHIELLDYYFQMQGFRGQNDVGFFIELANITDEFENSFTHLKKRKLKKARFHNLAFRRLDSTQDVCTFYAILSDNMKKFSTTPLHTLDELLEFKKVRLKDIVSFYGVFHGTEMIAGSMVFDFNNKRVFHTQYLASRHDRLELCPNEFLYVSLMKEAKAQGFQFLSFGTATLNHGEVFNKNLAQYKEGFHSESYVNRTYILEV